MSTLRRRVAVAALLLLVPALAACGFGEQTDQVYQAATGVNDRSGQVWILNGTIVSDQDGTGTFAGTLVDQSQAKPAKLVDVSGAEGSVSVTIPAGQVANLGSTGQIRLSDPKITQGAFVPVTFTFDNGQITTVSLPVVDHSGDYAGVPVGPTASPTPTKNPTSSKTGAPVPATSTASPASGPTSSPTASPTS